MVDAAHLKGEFKGHMLLAVAMDGNNQILPLAYGICKSESLQSWTWFLTCLRRCIHIDEGLTFISDRAASIAGAIATVFPQAEHGICGHHLYMNVSSKYGKIKK